MNLQTNLVPRQQQGARGRPSTTQSMAVRHVALRPRPPLIATSHSGAPRSRRIHSVVKPRGTPRLIGEHYVAWVAFALTFLTEGVAVLILAHLARSTASNLNVPIRLPLKWNHTENGIQNRT